MQNKLGITALEIINPNLRIKEWLRGMAAKGLIGQDAVREAGQHFKVQRDRADWQLFLHRIFALIGALLAAAGIIFFMAWNWESMSRFTKFAVLEAFFALFAAYSFLRWKPGPQGEAGWDARIALLGAGILAGGLMALYGQVYQTGADPWELFRAWTILLVLLALAGKSTVFWFTAWVVGNLWFMLYLELYIFDLFDGKEILLFFALFQFALLAVAELAGKLAKRFGGHFDDGRWLARIIGCTAIIAMGWYAQILALESFRYNYQYGGSLDSGAGTLFYLLSIAAIGLIYYRLVPELAFLALSIFSFTAYLATSLMRSMVEDLLRNAPEILLVIGLIFIGGAFGALKLVLLVRKRLRQRVLDGNSVTSATARLFKTTEAKKVELANWLTETGEADPAALEDFFAAYQAEEDAKWPWYARLFVTIGVWLGSLAFLGFLSFFLLEGLLNDPVIIGIIGLIFCAISLWAGSGSSLGARAFSQCIGVCGLVYSLGLTDFKFRPATMVLGFLLGLFWLFKPPYAGRLLAFLGLLVCLFLYIDAPNFARPYYYDLSQPLLLYTYLKFALCCLGLLWAAHYFVVMQGKLPAALSSLNRPALKGRFDLEEALGSSALACLLFFASLALYQQLNIENLIYINFRVTVPPSLFVLTGLLAWRYPAARSLCIPFGLALAVAGWFAPALALGLALLFLAYHSGHLGFLALAVIYLVAGNIIYYYNLDISLLYKSLVLMAVGVCFLAISAGMKFLSARVAATGASL